MSGGSFGYKQHHILDLIEQMDEILTRVEKEPSNEFECNSLKNYIDDIDSFKSVVITNIQHLKMAHLYTQRLDWFVSGDDGEESFYERIQEDIESLT